MHDLRHKCASLLIREGVGVMAVSKQLGHSTPTVTLNGQVQFSTGADRPVSGLSDFE
jgi:integrase